jgi:hypothetical protein
MTPSEQTTEVINEDVSPSTTKSTDLGDDPFEVSVPSEESALSLQKEEPCGERSQGSCFCIVLNKHRLIP